MRRKKHPGKFRVFHRVWWKANPTWPNGKEPHAGKKYTINYFETEESARACAMAWNAAHDPGPMSRKAEYEEV